MNDVIFGGSDPLLGNNPYGNSSPNTMEIDAYMQKLKQTQQQLEQQRQQIVNSSQSQQGHSPLWDEIDKEIAAMTDGEFQAMGNNPDFQKSNAAIMGIFNREHLRIMRPIVEQTKDGHEALEQHLKIVQNLKKQYKDDSNKNLELFNEYTEHYSDMTFAEFLKMKKAGGKKK